MKPTRGIGSDADKIPAMARPIEKNYLAKEKWSLPTAVAARAGADDYKAIPSRSGDKRTKYTGGYHGEIGGAKKKV